MTSSSLLSALLFVTTALSWGSSFLFIERCLEFVDPLSLTTISFFCSGLLSAFFASAQCCHNRATRQQALSLFSSANRGQLKRLILFALLFNVGGISILQVGQLKVASGIVGVLMIIEPLTCSLYSHFSSSRSGAAATAVVVPEPPDHHAQQSTPVHTVTSGKRLTTITGTGLIMGVVGTIVCSSPTLTEPSSAVFAVLVMMSSVMFAVATLTVGDPGDSDVDVPLFVRISVQLLFSFLCVLPISSLCIYYHVFSVPSSSSLYSSSILYVFDLPQLAYIWIASLIAADLVAALSYYALIKQIGAWSACVNLSLPLVSLLEGYFVDDEWSPLSVSSRCLEVSGSVVALVGAVMVVTPSIMMNTMTGDKTKKMKEADAVMTTMTPNVDANVNLDVDVNVNEIHNKRANFVTVAPRKQEANRDLEKEDQDEEKQEEQIEQHSFSK